MFSLGSIFWVLWGHLWRGHPEERECEIWPRFLGQYFREFLWRGHPGVGGVWSPCQTNCFATCCHTECCHSAKVPQPFFFICNAQFQQKVCFVVVMQFKHSVSYGSIPQKKRNNFEQFLAATKMILCIQRLHAAQCTWRGSPITFAPLWISSGWWAPTLPCTAEPWMSTPGFFFYSRADMLWPE